MTTIKHEKTEYTRYFYTQYRAIKAGQPALNGITCMKTQDEFFHIGKTSETIRESLNADMVMVTDWREISKAQAEEYGEVVQREQIRRKLTDGAGPSLITPA